MESYAASVVRQRAVTKGPSKDRAGGVAVRPRGLCQAPRRAEASGSSAHQGASHAGKRHGDFLRSHGVWGGVTCSQWL